MTEATYQRGLIQKLKFMFPECQIIKLDPKDNQGYPDLLILYEDKWGALEIKISVSAHRQPNQSYYVEKFNKMSFASFICPETEDSVLDELRKILV